MKKQINLEEDFNDFIKLCNKFEVKYLVIGGYAVSIHGYPRSTKDLDICIEVSDKNADKMIEVIKEFGFSSMQLTKDDFLKPNFITQFGYEPLRIDLINDLDGVPFEEAWRNKRIVDMKGELVNFIGYYELLKVKAQAARPQDLADIDKLKKRNKDK